MHRIYAMNAFFLPLQTYLPAFPPHFRNLWISVIFFLKLSPKQIETHFPVVLYTYIHPLQICSSLRKPRSYTMSAVKGYVLVTWLLCRFHVTSWEKPVIKQCRQNNWVSNRLCSSWKLGWSVRTRRLMPWFRQWRGSWNGLRVLNQEECTQVLLDICFLPHLGFIRCLLVSKS